MSLSKLAPKNWSLKIQLFVVLFFTLWFVIIAASFSIRFFENNRQLENLDDRSHHTVVLTSEVMADAIMTKDVVRLETFIFDTIFSDEYIVRAEVLDLSGDVVVDITANTMGNELPTNPDQYVTHIDPLTYNGEEWGTIELTWNLDYVAQRVEERDRQTQALFDPLILLLAVLVLIFGYIFVARPMDMISHQIQLLLEEKDKDLKSLPPLKLDRAKEWAQLSRSTNLLQQAIIEGQEREKMMEDARDIAINMSQMKSEFMTNISHELRTPLNGIIGISDLMMSTRLDEEQREYSEMIKSSGNDLLDIITKILNFSSIEDGSLEVVNEPFSLVRAAEEVIETHRPNAAEKGLELTFLSQNAPSLIMGDKAKVAQVIHNLIENGIKFTHSGGVKLILSAGPSDNNRIRFTFDIIDTGIGIEPQILPELFQPFRQSDASLTRQYGGNGLGLAISKNLAELLGGTLEVMSVPSEGSTFSFSFPAEVAEQQNIMMDEQTKALHALVLEPNVISRKLLLTSLRKLEYSADFISESGDLRSCLLHNQYECVFIDGERVWPTLQSYEAELREIKSSRGLATRWILLISDDNLGYKIPDFFDGTLVKPIALKHLRQLLDHKTEEIKTTSLVL